MSLSAPRLRFKLQKTVTTILTRGDGRDVAFGVDATAAAGNGHTSLYFQNLSGEWLKYDQGARGETSSGGNLGFLSGSRAPAGVTIVPVEKPPAGAVRIKTTSEQDAKVHASAIRSKNAHNKDEVSYSLYSNNCTDAAVDVVNDSGAGIDVPNPVFTVKPNSWFSELKDWAKRKETEIKEEIPPSEFGVAP